MAKLNNRGSHSTLITQDQASLTFRENNKSGSLNVKVRTIPSCFDALQYIIFSSNMNL